jgi:hypothetical protein
VELDAQHEAPAPSGETPLPAEEHVPTVLHPEIGEQFAGTSVPDHIGFEDVVASQQHDKADAVEPPFAGYYSTHVLSCQRPFWDSLHDVFKRSKPYEEQEQALPTVPAKKVGSAEEVPRALPAKEVASSDDASPIVPSKDLPTSEDAPTTKEAVPVNVLDASPPSLRDVTSCGAGGDTSGAGRLDELRDIAGDVLMDVRERAEVAVRSTGLRLWCCA